MSRQCLSAALRLTDRAAAAAACRKKTLLVVLSVGYLSVCATTQGKAASLAAASTATEKRLGEPFLTAKRGSKRAEGLVVVVVGGGVGVGV